MAVAPTWTGVWRNYVTDELLGLMTKPCNTVTCIIIFATSGYKRRQPRACPPSNPNRRSHCSGRRFCPGRCTLEDGGLNGCLCPKERVSLLKSIVREFIIFGTYS
uniref:1-acyl-sn-glycerol-3-phosphate acyltransferase beta n=1 Tax=Schistocephalus solidus TaxID=70667 RepID=A0A0V0JBF1_SCHSO